MSSSHPEVTEICRDIDRLPDFNSLVHASGQGKTIGRLIDKVSPLFEACDATVQAHAYGILFGMFLGACEGFTVEADKSGIITSEDRLTLFNTVARKTLSFVQQALAEAAAQGTPAPSDTRH